MGNINQNINGTQNININQKSKQNINQIKAKY